MKEKVVKKTEENKEPVKTYGIKPLVNVIEAGKRMIKENELESIERRMNIHLKVIEQLKEIKGKENLNQAELSFIETHSDSMRKNSDLLLQRRKSLAESLAQ